MRTDNLLAALLAGLIAFLVVFIVIAILELIFAALALPQIAGILNLVQFWVSLLAGIVVGYNRYHGRSTL